MQPEKAHISDKPPVKIHERNAFFRTWWTQLSSGEGSYMREKIMTKCEWSRQVWYYKIHGYTKLTLPEMTVIAELAGQEPGEMFQL